MFKNLKKEDIVTVLTELGEMVNIDMKMGDLKQKLLTSKEYLEDAQFVKDFLISTLENRKTEEKIISKKKRFGEKKSGTHKKVPEEFQAEILLKLLGDKASNVLVYIKEEDLKDYAKVKALILKEFEPTPQPCLENFRKAKRNSGETHIQFVSRLTSTWEYYCKLRKVEDYESLKELIISDKLFQALDNDTASHICLKQGEKWLRPQELAKECDIYFGAKQKHGGGGTIGAANRVRCGDISPLTRTKSEISEALEYADDVTSSTGATRLREEQRSCPSLKEAFLQCRAKKGNYSFIDGLLHHSDKILGQPVTLLVLPQNRRQQVLKLAHESVFGAHMGMRKTKERIHYSFYWPGLSQDVEIFCKTCKECQLRSPEKKTDRIPITPVSRPDLPFQVINVDIIGPIEPPSAREYKYALCLI
ncbi:hypothetical protein AVEN_274867-1 [Araneus ventricosus]|uniref:Integrase zinc-binding domain-containing protein n=1 Tax=Araneus ventricosus TaxID=182803 RepID=A0A4Y2K1H9_ARAVE|nr:hypothetical protein AVEN_274867-1 [Araneus ventricosus]